MPFSNTIPYFGSNILVFWQGWACWKRCFWDEMEEGVRFNSQSQICEPSRWACGSHWVFPNKTWVLLVLFPFSPHMSCLLHSIFGAFPKEIGLTPRVGWGDRARWGAEWPPPPQAGRSFFSLTFLFSLLPQALGVGKVLCSAL